MSILRGRLTGDGFTAVPNHWLRDPQLSYKGKGLLAAIASHRDDYELTIDQLIAESKDGKDAVATAMRELERAGYLRRLDRRRNADGTLGAYDYELVEFPHVTPAADSVPAGQGQCGKPAVGPVRKTRTGHHQPKQGVSAGRNQCGFTTAVNPHSKKTMGLEDQENITSPLPLAPPTSAGAGEVQEEGEISPESTRGRGGTSSPVSADALAVVDGAAWPVGKPRPTPVDRQRLGVEVDACLVAGHALVDVRRELAASGDAQRPVGAAIARLRQLAGTTPLVSRAAAGPRPAAAADGAGRHAYRDGGPNGACTVCGRAEPARVHLAAPRATARCPHGRIPVACPTCRASQAASHAVSVPPTRHTGNGA